MRLALCQPFILLTGALLTGCNQSDPATAPRTEESNPFNADDFVVYDGDILIPKADYQEWLSQPKLQPWIPKGLAEPKFKPDGSPLPLAKTAQQQVSSLISSANVGSITIRADASVPSNWLPYIDRAITHYQQITNSTSLRISRVTTGGKIILSMTPNFTSSGICMDAAYPSGGNPGSRIRINSGSTAFMANPALWTPAIIHEIGHTLGLVHTNETDTYIPTTPSLQKSSIMQGGTCHQPALGLTHNDHKALIYLYPPTGTRPLLSWWLGSINKHFYSLSPEGLKTDPDDMTATNFYEANIGLLYLSSGTNRAALHRFLNNSTSNHLYTTNFSEGNVSGFTYEGITGYLSTTQIAGTLPFYRFWNASLGDHFYKTSSTAPAGWVLQPSTPIGYILTTPQ